MIEAAEASGAAAARAAPSSSRPAGNTGVGLAIVAPAQGYHCVFVCPDKVSPGQDQRAAGVRRRGRGLPDRRRPGAPGLVLLGLRPARAGDPGRLEAGPVLQPEQPAVALPHDRPGAVGPDRRPDHRLRRRRRHRRHDQRHRPLPEGGLGRRGQDHRRRPGGLGLLRRHRAARTWSRASARTSGRSATTARHRRGRSRSRDKRLVRDDPAAGPRGGPAGRRLVRDGRGRGAACTRSG